MSCLPTYKGKRYNSLSEVKSQIRKDNPIKKEIEIDKLPDNMTLGDLADLLAYSNSKLILPGNEVVYTTPDNQKFKTYQEASNHISELIKLGEVDLSKVGLNIAKNINEVPKKDFVYYELADKLSGDSHEIQVLYNPEDKTGWFMVHPYDGELYPLKDSTVVKYYNDSGVLEFLEKNKEYEQSREIIEEWKKVNDIKYDPEEAYSRGNEFIHIHNAYGKVDTNTWLSNLLNNLDDLDKINSKMELSFITTPKGTIPNHMKRNLNEKAIIKIKVYPKSEDIAFASKVDNFTSSYSINADSLNTFIKESRVKQKEETAVSFTKSVPLKNLNTIEPNIADTIDDVAHHNEYAIAIRNGNFRLEYGPETDYSTKKLINTINNILDQKYGKLVEPEINNNSNVKNENEWFIQYDNGNYYMENYKGSRSPLYKTEEEAVNWLKSNNGKQPTQTKESLKESIESVKSKIDASKGSFWDILTTEEVVGYENENGYLVVDYSGEMPTKEVFKTEKEAKNWIDNNLPKQKEYTSQALTNTKVAALKKGFRKYPRSLIRSEVRPIQNTTQNYGFSKNELPFQKLSSKEDESASQAGEQTNIEKRTNDLKELSRRIKTEDVIFFTGKPGVGKTHTLARFITQQKAAGKNVLAVAKTNIAKGILGSYPGVSSATIDQALRINPSMGINETPDNLKTLFEGIDIIIIDEIQMLNQEDLDKLKVHFPNKKIILSGDPYQTPMDNANTESGISPVFSMPEYEKGMVLEGRIRQGETNPILSLADDITTIIDGLREPSDIFEGNIEEWDSKKGVGVKYEESLDKALNQFLKDVYDNPNTRIITFNNHENKNQDLSVYHINRKLAEKLHRNLEDPLIAGDKAIFYKHLMYSDKSENRYFTNSEEVTIVDNTDSHIVIEDEKGKIYTLEKNESLDLQPAWAITSNKATGASYDKVYVLVDNILQKEELANFRYLNTAVTRAKKGVVLVSEKFTNENVDRTSEYSFLEQETIPDYLPTIDEKIFEPKPIYTAEVIAPARFPLATGGFVDMNKKDSDGNPLYYTIDEDTGAMVLRPEMFDKQTLEMLSYRIPTSSHQSIVQLKIVAFSNSSDQFIVDPSSLPLVGEDNDGDARKTFHQFTTTDENGRVIIDNPTSPVTPSDRKKAAQNKLYRIYSSVYKSGHPKILENSQKILSTEVAENSVRFIEEAKVNTTSNLLPAGSSKARFQTMRAGSVGKVGIGIHSLYVRIASEIQKYNGSVSNSSLKLESTLIPRKGILLGGFEKLDGELFPVKNLTHKPTSTTSFNAEQGAENQNIATDNANLGLMDKRGETSDFITYFAGMHALGIYKLKYKGKEVDYPSAFFSHSQVREIFSNPEKIDYLLKLAKALSIHRDETIDLNNLSYEKLINQVELSKIEQIHIARLAVLMKKLSSSIKSLTDNINANELTVTGGFDNVYDREVISNYIEQEESFSNLGLFLNSAEFDKSNQSKRLMDVVINKLDLTTNEGVNVRKAIKSITDGELTLADLKSYLVSNSLGINATLERDRLTLKGNSLGEYINKYKTHPALYNNVFIQKLFGSDLPSRFLTDDSERIIIDYEDQGSTDVNNIMLQEAAFSDLHESETPLPPFQGDQNYTSTDLAIDLMIYSVLVDGYVAGPKSFIRRISPEYFDRLGINKELSKVKELSEADLVSTIKQAFSQKKKIKTPRFRTYDSNINTIPVSKLKLIETLEKEGVSLSDVNKKLLNHLLETTPLYTKFVINSDKTDRFVNNTVYISNETMRKAESTSSFDVFFYNLMEEIAHSVINSNLNKYIKAFHKGSVLGRESLDYFMGKHIMQTYNIALQEAQKESWWSNEKFESLKSNRPVTISTEQEAIMYSLTSPLELYAHVAAKKPEIVSYLANKKDPRYNTNILERIYNTATELIRRAAKILFPEKNLENLSILETIESELVFLPKKTAAAAKLEMDYHRIFTQRDAFVKDLAKAKNLPDLSTKAYLRLIRDQNEKDC